MRQTTLAKLASSAGNASRNLLADAAAGPSSATTTKRRASHPPRDAAYYYEPDDVEYYYYEEEEGGEGSVLPADGQVYYEEEGEYQQEEGDVYYQPDPPYPLSQVRVRLLIFGLSGSFCVLAVSTHLSELSYAVPCWLISSRHECE